MASRLFKRFALLAALPLMAISCVDKNYDLAKLDTEMTLFGNGINVPVGSTNKILMDKIFNIESQGGEYLITDASGNYMLKYSKTDAGMNASFNIPAMNFTNAISIESSTTTVNAEEYAGVVVPANQSKTYTLNALEIPIELDVAVPDGVSDIQWIEMNSAMNLIINANIPIANLKAGYGINFPKFLTLEAIGTSPDFTIESGHIIRFVNDINLGSAKSYAVAIKKMDLTKLPSGQGVQNGRLSISQTAQTEGNQLLVVGDGTTTVPATVDLIITGNIDNVEVSQLSAKLDKSVNIPSSVVKISGLPEFLKESTIKLDNCAVKFLVNNDSPFALSLNMNIASTANGKTNTANLKDLAIKTGNNVLFLTDGSSAAPSDATATYIVDNINDIFGSLAEQISISDGVASLAAKSFTTIPASVSGNVSAGFEFSAPLSFQAGGEISFETTLDNLNLNLDSYGSSAIELKMNAVNSIPMDFTISVGDCFDSQGTKIFPKLEVSQPIKAGSTNSPATTALTLSLSAPGVKSVKSIDLVLTAKAKGNEPLNKNQYVQFTDIIASLPNGITLK